MVATIPELKFDASTLPARQQFRAWAALVPRYDVETADPDEGFVAVASAWMVGPMVVTLNRLGPVTMRRTPALIRADDADHYCMVMLLEGSWSGDVDGRAIRMGTEDICMLDLARPMESIGSPNRSITLLMPRIMLDEAIAPFDLHGLVLRAGAGALLSDYIKALVRRLPEIDAADAGQVAVATRDHIAATLRTVRGRMPQPTNATVLAQAKRYIALNLGGDLSTPAICKALKISRSTLYRAFEALDGVSSYVQERRLARAHALLCGEGELRSVTEIAYDAGFASVAHFYRQFRKTYGYTARELQARSEPVTPQLPQTEEPQLTFRDWTKILG